MLLHLNNAPYLLATWYFLSQFLPDFGQVFFSVQLSFLTSLATVGLVDDLGHQACLH